MGMIRKTLSIGTLGLVSFRSKKEKLARSQATTAQVAAERDLERAARLDAETRAATAHVQLKLAKREAAVASKQAAKLRKRGKRGKRAKRSTPLADVGGALTSAVKSAEPAVRSGVESAQHLAHDAAVAGRKFGKRARKQATPVLKSGAESAQQLAHAAAEQARHLAEAAHAKVTEVRESVQA